MELPWWNIYKLINLGDVFKWKHFLALLALCAGKSPVNDPHKGQWRRALIFYLICAWINAWVNNRSAGGLRRHRAHYDVIIMLLLGVFSNSLVRSFNSIFGVRKTISQQLVLVTWHWLTGYICTSYQDIFAHHPIYALLWLSTDRF